MEGRAATLLQLNLPWLFSQAPMYFPAAYLTLGRLAGTRVRVAVILTPAYLTLARLAGTCACVAVTLPYLTLVRLAGTLRLDIAFTSPYLTSWPGGWEGGGIEYAGADHVTSAAMTASGGVSSSLSDWRSK